MRVDPVHRPPLGLDGAGVKGGMWEADESDSPGIQALPDLVTLGGRAKGHDDFYTGGAPALRVTASEQSALSDHATLVAGILLGDGAAGGPRGVAPRAGVYAYTAAPSDDRATEVATAKSQLNIAFSTNSWSLAACRCSDTQKDCDALNPCDPPGTCTVQIGMDSYTPESQKYDDVVRGSAVPVFFGAGNAADAPCVASDPSGPWHSIGSGGGTAKNTVTVGSIQSDTDAVSVFSSRGPTKDGRIKPDLMAPGAEQAGDKGIRSTTSDPPDGYDVAEGTSLSTPAVAGAGTLLIADWRARNAGKPDPLPSTLKALLICGARDLDTPGPNFDSGWGAVDVLESDLLLRRGAVTENEITMKEVDTRNLTVPAGARRLRVTLVWDDPGQTPNAAGPALVNDLNLSLNDGTLNHFPWKLDPSAPQQAATRDPDSLNNVEQVEVDNPRAGAWTIRVSGLLAKKVPQKYSLCVRVETGAEPTILTGKAHGLGRPGRGGLRITERFPLAPTVDLSKSVVTITHLLAERAPDGSVRELVAGLPVALGAIPGSRPGVAVYETTLDNGLGLRMTLRSGGVFRLDGALGTIAPPALCEGTPPAVRLTTRFVIDDFVNPPLVVEGTRDWSCLERGGVVNYLRTP
jgi:hypothetical protein